jgi:hypothetical protein
VADNLTLPATAAVVAADDVSSVFYQYIKLASSESASADLIGDTDHGSTRALHVDPRYNVLAQTQASTGLTTASTAYSIADTLGAGWTFTSMARESGGSGVIVGAALLDKADIVSGVTLFFSSATVTFGTDNSALSISDADAANLFAPLALSSDDIGSSHLLAAHGLWIPYTCAATSLFVYARTDVAHTFFGAVGDLSLKLLYIPA